MTVSTSPSPAQTRLNPRAAVGFLVYLLLTPAALLLAGGDLRWGMAWAYIAITLAGVIGSRLLVLKKNPAMLAERSRFAEVEGVPAWDRLMSLFVGLVGPFILIIVEGLDHRFAWGPAVSLAWQAVFMVIVLLTVLVAVWAMLANAYFSAVVRIQRDRGQTVVSSGPYAAVRHPAYAAGIISSLAAPLALDAVWALVPALLMIIVLVVRTALEDQMLQRELPGYRDYAARVRYRLLPGIW
jgi:protein-S-isoprenylcysteine O-methyltransferase Ste14